MSTIMSNTTFVERLTNVLNYKTLYVYGGFGAPLTASMKTRVINAQEFNRTTQYRAIMAASNDTFGFDCVGLVKGTLWGWNADLNHIYGGSRYATNGLPDAGIRTLYYNYSTEQSAQFDVTTMVPGEIVVLKDFGHIGVYIGNGLAIESTPKWNNRVQVTACNCDRPGYNRRNWDYHAKLTSYVSYPASGKASTINATGFNQTIAANIAAAKRIATNTVAEQMSNIGNRDSSVNTNTTAALDYATTNAEGIMATRYTIRSKDESTSTYSYKFRVDSLRGIEGIPYQFLPSVDRRIDTSKQSSANDNYIQNVEEVSLLGRKYTEKIVTQIPLLFLAPCNPLFMSDNSFNDNDRQNMASAMLGAFGGTGDDGLNNIISGHGRFYSAEYAYGSYYSYLNAMLRSVALFLGIGDEKVLLGNGSYCELKNVNWANDINSDFADAYLAEKNLMFYIDSIDTITENFANSSRQSSIAALINGFSDTAKEIDYLFGTGGSNMVSSIKESVSEGAGSISAAIGDVLGGNIGGGIVGSLGNGGLESIVDGGKIVFPEMWDDSSFDRSYAISIKLRSPDNDSLSIFMNVLKPYCKILALTLPHMIKDNVNTYRTPFITKAYCKGLFNIDLGMITGLSVSKGATCAWNDDGLPTQIDLEIDIKDLYSQLTMTGFLEDDTARNNPNNILTGLTSEAKQIYNIACNTSYMDFLANMAGLNINQMEWTRKFKVWWDLAKGEISQYNAIQTNIGNRLTDAISNTVLKFYNFP